MAAVDHNLSQKFLHSLSLSLSIISSRGEYIDKRYTTVNRFSSREEKRVTICFHRHSLDENRCIHLVTRRRLSRIDETRLFRLENKLETSVCIAICMINYYWKLRYIKGNCVLNDLWSLVCSFLSADFYDFCDFVFTLIINIKKKKKKEEQKDFKFF